MLQARGAIADAQVLDLFAGTGALAFEMLSRGAASALLVDADRRACRAMEGNARALELAASQARVLVLDLLGDPTAVARRMPDRDAFTLVFADPPWSEVERLPPLLLGLAGAGVIAADATLVIEHAARDELALPNGLASLASYRYGDTAILLARPVKAPA